MTTVELSPEAARRKDLHRRSMVWTGMFMTACGLAAAYVAMTSGPLPALFFGRWGAAAPPAQGHFRRARPAAVLWRPWGRSALEDAAKSGRLVLLDVCVGWNRACGLMDETTYADPAVAGFIARRLTAVRVDADERPDVAARYLSGGWPSTLLLLPDGRELGRATFLTPELFLPWASAIDGAYQRRGAAPRVEKTEDDGSAAAFNSSEALESARGELANAWESGGARFPRFDRIELLKAIPGVEWTQSLARQALESAANLQDPVWGGYFRCADGPGWGNPETEKLLADQAQAILALGPGEAARRTLAYVDRFLAGDSGYYAGQSCEVRRGSDVIEGRYYYSLSDAERRRWGLPQTDRRQFAAANALMIRAALLAGDLGQKKRALAALDGFWARGTRDGQVRHELSSPRPAGLLTDQAAFGRALLAAYAETKDKRWLARAREVAKTVDRSLLDPASGACFDRPATGELPPALDRLLLPGQNFELWLFLRELPAVSPARLRALAAWLKRSADRLDPAARAALSVLR